VTNGVGDVDMTFCVDVDVVVGAILWRRLQIHCKLLEFHVANLAKVV
jgi:hypothetical protein